MKTPGGAAGRFPRGAAPWGGRGGVGAGGRGFLPRHISSTRSSPSPPPSAAAATAATTTGPATTPGQLGELIGFSAALSGELASRTV